jgi:hypothetical protein
VAATILCKFHHAPGGTCVRGRRCYFLHGPKSDTSQALVDSGSLQSAAAAGTASSSSVAAVAAVASVVATAAVKAESAAASAGPALIEAIDAFVQQEAASFAAFYRQRHPALPRRFKIQPQYSTAVLTLNNPAGSFDVLATGMQALIVCVLGHAPRSLPRAELQAALGCPAACADFDCAMSALTAPAHPLVVSTAAGLALSEWRPVPPAGSSSAPLSLLDAVELCDTDSDGDVRPTWRTLNADARSRQQRIDEFDNVTVRALA